MNPHAADPDGLFFRAGLALLTLWAPVYSAATIHVPAEHATIQEALDAANDGDTVLVAPGVYEVTRAIDGNRPRGPVAPGKNFTLRSEAGPQATTIRCTARPEVQPSSVLVFRRGEGPLTLIEGFTIEGGSGTLVFFEGTGGGGILCIGSSPTIRGCRIRGNSATTSGGGILAIDGAQMTVADCLIEGNEADLGGGVAVHGDTPEVRTAITLRNTRLLLNQSLIGGGASCLDAAVLDVEGCTFTGNEALVLGGGLAYEDGTVSVAGSSFLDNRAEDGGGFYAGAGLGRFVNCLIAGNAAYNGGGAMFEPTPGVYFEDSSTLLFNCTIADNSAIESASGGIYFLEPEGDLVNSIVWGNEGGSLYADGGMGRFTHCQVEGPEPPEGEGNSNQDPLFVAKGRWNNGGTDDDPFDDRWQAGDYHLAAGSPAIDAGTAHGAPALDLEGRSRPCGAGIDVGAYESGGCETGGARFRRGDANADRVLDLADAIYTLDALFRGGPPPPCADAADADDNGRWNLTDPIFTLGHLFRGGPSPPAPEACGGDPTADGLGCTGGETNC